MATQSGQSESTSANAGSKDTTGSKFGSLKALKALNFFMADIQAGIGPFLGVFLLAHGWKSGLIGSVMTIGGWLAQSMGYPSAFLLLGSFAWVSIVLWVLFANTLKSACDTSQPVTALA